MSVKRKLEQIESLSNVVSDLVEMGDHAYDVPLAALKVLKYLAVAAQHEAAEQEQAPCFSEVCGSLHLKASA